MAQAATGDMTDGEVRKVDKEGGKLTLKHADIKSLDMPAMTMVFTVKDKAMLDKLKGRLNRLGKDMWTTLLTTVPLELGGAKVAAGSYVVGLMCDKDGKFHLALLDATKAAKAGTLPFGQQTWTPDVLCPLTLNKDGAKEAAEKMTMTLAADEKDPSRGTLVMRWGPFEATAAVGFQVAGAKAAGEAKK